MARPGINYIDVSKAAQVIIGNGQNPTVDRVLAHLGTGSKSTITPLLKQWKAESQQSVVTVGLSDEILKAVKEIHERLQQSADLKIELAKDKNQAQILEAEIKLEDTINQVQLLTQNTEQLTSQIDAEKAESTALRDLLEAERITVAQLRTEHKQATSQVEQAKATIQEQRQEISQVRESFEHYQAQAAEDRQREREQYQISKHQLDDTIQSVRLQLDTEITRYNHLNIEKQQLTDQVAQLSGDLIRVKEDSQVQTLNIAQLTQQLEREEISLSEIRDENRQLDTRYAKLLEEFNEMKLANQLSGQKIEQLEVKLSSTTDKLTLVDTENKLICQEKAMLQGQFKQLLESI